MDNLGDAWEGGGGIGMIIFALFAALLIFNAPSLEVVVERFARFWVAVALTLAPTSPAAVVIAVVSALLGGISASKVPANTPLKVFTFGMVYMLFALSVNYLTAPV